jgi:hypothetical protein
MTQAATELLNAVLALPESDRSEIAELLAASVEPPAGLHPAWGPELRRRAAQLDSGVTKCVPLAEVLLAIEKQLAEGVVTRG